MNPPVEQGPGWRLYHAECRSIMARLPAGSVQGLIADPPYCSGGWSAAQRRRPVDRKYHLGAGNGPEVTQPTFSGDQRDQRSFTIWCERWLGDAYRILAPASPAFIFTDWRQLPAVVDAVQVAGFVARGVIVWDKVGGRPRPNSVRCGTEFIVYASKGDTPPRDPAVYLPHVIRGSPPRGEDREHITEKPVEAVAPLVDLVEPGGVVFDPFAGSGTVGEACLQAGRGYVGCEWDAHYHLTAAARLAVLGAA